jgi:hypothetical protein
MPVPMTPVSGLVRGANRTAFDGPPTERIPG